MPMPMNSNRPQQYDPQYESYNGMADDETLSSAYLGTAHIETDLAKMDIAKIKTECETRIDRIMASMDPIMFLFIMDCFSKYIPSEEPLDIEDPFVMEDFAMFSELLSVKEETVETVENAKDKEKTVSAEFIGPEILNYTAIEDSIALSTIAFFKMMEEPVMEFRAVFNPDVKPQYTWVKPEDVLEYVLKMRLVEKMNLAIELLESLRIGINERGKKIGMGEHFVRMHAKENLDSHYKSAVDRFQEKER